MSSLPSADSALQASSARARAALDVFVDGANVTARFAESDAPAVLRELALGLATLAKTPNGKAIVHFYEDAAELAVERSGARAWISVYRGGAEPKVSVYDRPVLFADVIASAREATLSASARDPEDADLAHAAEALVAIDASPGEAVVERELAHVHLDIDDDAPLSFGAAFSLRGGAENVSSEVERADLHALLFRGKMRAGARGRVIPLREAHPFLFAEKLLDLAVRTLETATRGAESNVRVDAGGVILAVRLSATGEIALTVGDLPTIGCTFPALAASDLVDAALIFGRSLVRAILRRDRSQAGNLRFGAFRRRLRQVGETSRELRREDVKVNPRPEAYRAFADGDRSGAREKKSPASMPAVAAPTRLRYASRWRALVPGIDLRGTFLCGDRLIVGAAAETFCLDRSTGEVLWRVPTSRATSLVTPGGVARLHADGNVHLHDFGDGEITMRADVAPRIGAPPLGVVVGGAGLPRLLIVTEGERHLVALDLVHGQARWRAPWSGGTSNAARRSGDTPRKLNIKRAGKLLYVTSGDSALTAIDALSGAVVWRMRDPLRFAAGVTLGHDLLYAVAGGARGKARLHAIDAFSGQVRWSSDVRKSDDAGEAASASAVTIDGLPILSEGTVALAVRERHGVSLVAFDRSSGDMLWRTGPQASSNAPVAASGTAWIGIDDLYVGNSATGELVGVEASTGTTRYRHVLGRSLEEDTPRRLEPILRSGALFVPHTDVHVFRPRDGAPLGSIAPCDAIPDLLRVDERCDVYVAEESGHLVSFGAGPRLSLVR